MTGTAMRLDARMRDVIRQQVKRHGSFYLYDERRIHESVDCLASHFPQIDFLYSIKCNANPHVLRSIFARGLGADAASAAEVRMARAAGVPKDRILYSSPGKMRSDIARTIRQAVLVADSIEELRRIQNVAAEMNMPVAVGMRINPDFTFHGDGGLPSKFGIDEEQALAFLRGNDCPNIRVTGIHVHLRSQELQADVLAAYYRRMFRLAEKFSAVCGGLEYVNMGSGMGVRYAVQDTPLNLAALGAALREELRGFQTAHPRTACLIEVGRYAVCASGLYVASVVDRKISRGITYIILRNTLNGFLRPSLARLASRWSRGLPSAAEPLFTCVDACQFFTLDMDAPVERVTLAGDLCTTADIIAEDILLPHVECGDCVIMTNAGSYAAVLSPMQFSSHERPVEVFLSTDGTVLQTDLPCA
ncbi:MAG: alanine racemase [Desulfovibrionaceae bacterium]|nr:alanine racemase [Desulfovibrionaceae bacterium]